MSNLLQITLWNANGLSQHVEEVKIFILNHNIDIMLVSETHFTERSHFKIPNYSLYCTKHPIDTARGGSTVIIKNWIKHHQTNGFRTNFLQATNIAIEDSSGSLTISAVYFSPRHWVPQEHCGDSLRTMTVPRNKVTTKKTTNPSKGSGKYITKTFRRTFVPK